MNTDELEGLDDATRKEIEELQKVNREEHGNEKFAKAQLQIGNIFAINRNLESAVKAWEKVTRVDNPEVYTQAQSNTGVAFVESDKDNLALSVFNNIKITDDLHLFSRAQLNIGNIFIRDGDLKSALIAWSNIKRIYSAELYGQAQFNIGLASLKNSDIEEALLAWRNIASEDNAKMYGQAQFNIGVALEKSGNFEGALLAWRNITSENNAKMYGQAQINIGNVLVRLDELEAGLDVWRNLKFDNDVEIYALAQLNTGIALEINNDTERALKAWNNIKSDYSSETYAKAQLSIGIALEESGDIEKALSIWVNNIKRSDDGKTYAKAQIAIGNTLEKAYSVEDILRVWSEVDIKDCPEMYAVAQYQIGIYLINDNVAKNYSDAKKAFANADLAYPYESYCYEKICDLLSVFKTEFIGEKLLELFDRTLNIIDILKLDFGQDSSEDKPPERKLAHYTGTYTTDKLLAIDKKANLPSAFRLNTINNVNDPSEGQLLVNYLNNMQEKYFYDSGFDENLHAFISCFTFNHDSLNQFRLYGKQDNKEASGISLVFKKEFFQPHSLLKGLSYLSPKNNLQELDNEFINQNPNDEVKVAQHLEVRYRVSKQPVMRCVYLDPISSFTQLAQRNKLTFYREFENAKVTHKIEDITKEKNKAKVEWLKYTNDIKEKTKFFNKEFKYLKKAYKKVIKEKAKIGKGDQKFLDEIEVLLGKILLPLKYLIKHSAFQEEQECRIVYITSLDDEKVKMEFGKFLYVEYEADVKDNLDKIYIAPAATQYQPYLAKLLCDSNVKIELSNNPYRQT